MTIVEYQSNHSPQQCCIPSSSPWLILEKAKTDMWGGLERPQIERAQSMRCIPVGGRPCSNTPGLKNSCQIAVVSTLTRLNRLRSCYITVWVGQGWSMFKETKDTLGRKIRWGKLRVNSIYQWPAGGDPSADRIPTCPILTLDPASGDGAANAPNCQLDTVPRTRSCFHTVRDRNSKVDQSASNQTKPCSTHFTLSRVDGCYTN